MNLNRPVQLPFAFAMQVMIAFVLCAVSGPSVSAQPLTVNMTSVEWLTAESVQIVTATLVRYEAIPNSNFYEATIEVHDTLKGEHIDTIQFVDQHGFGRYSCEDLIADQQKLIFFFSYWVETADPSRTARHYARHKYIRRDSILLEPKKIGLTSEETAPVVTSDLRELHSSKEVIAAIKSYLASRNPENSSLPAPILTRLPNKYNYGGILGQLVGPADAALPNTLEPAVVAKKIDDFQAFKRQHGTTRPANAKQYGGQRHYDFESGARVDSLELMIEDCDTVISGTISDYCYLPGPKNSGDPLYGNYAIELEVKEVFKGEGKKIGQRDEKNEGTGKRAKTRIVFIPNQIDLKPFYESKQPMLFFLRRTDRNWLPFHARSTTPHSCEGWSILQRRFDYSTRSSCWDNSIISLAEDKAQALFSDLTWQSNPTTIQERIREVLQEEWKHAPPGSPWSPFENTIAQPINFPVGQTLTDRTPLELSSKVHYQIPVDHHLENHAKQWITSKDKNRRLIAARCLGFFRSDDNADLLRSLLYDEAQWPRKFVNEWTNGHHHRVNPTYLIRYEAWLVLTAWGEECELPEFAPK